MVESGEVRLDCQNEPMWRPMGPFQMANAQSKMSLYTNPSLYVYPLPCTSFCEFGGGWVGLLHKALCPVCSPTLSL